MSEALMAEWLWQVSEWHEMYCRDLEVHEFEHRAGRTWSA